MKRTWLRAAPRQWDGGFSPLPIPLPVAPAAGEVSRMQAGETNVALWDWDHQEGIGDRTWLRPLHKLLRFWPEGAEISLSVWWRPAQTHRGAPSLVGEHPCCSTLPPARLQWPASSSVSPCPPSTGASWGACTVFSLGPSCLFRVQGWGTVSEQPRTQEPVATPHSRPGFQT